MVPFISVVHMLLLLLPIVSLLVGLLYLLHGQWGRHGRRRRLPLPPGSMGWPYIGETLKLYTHNPNTFFSLRRKKYGDIFKSHILGCPCVMIASPEAAHTVLVSKSHLFKPTYPPSKEKMIGPEALFFHQGDYHYALKKLVKSSLAPASIRAAVANIENIAVGFLQEWENTSICTLQEMKRYAFEVAMIYAFGNHPEPETQGIKSLYQRLEKGYNSMPMDFQGTPFHKAMKARKVLNERLRALIQKRRESGENRDGGGGLLGILVKSQKELTDSQIADNIIGVVFAAHDTTASVLTWLLKYLHDNPQVLEATTREQRGIRRALLRDERGLTLDDTRQMLLTSRVIQETLRTASILSFTFREAVEDVELQGYVIPKGWKVLPLFRSIHHSSDLFQNPEKFDPSRFEVQPRSNTFMPFGKGSHACPGGELAKIEMLVLLHHLTTKFRWRVLGEDDGIQYCPFPVPNGGLPVFINRIQENKN